MKKNYLPLGLTAGVKMLRDVKANSILSYDDISIEHQTNAYKLRKSLEKSKKL